MRNYLQKKDIYNIHRLTTTNHIDLGNGRVITQTKYKNFTQSGNMNDTKSIIHTAFRSSIKKVSVHSGMFWGKLPEDTNAVQGVRVKSFSMTYVFSDPSLNVTVGQHIFSSNGKPADPCMTQYWKDEATIQNLLENRFKEKHMNGFQYIETILELSNLEPAYTRTLGENLILKSREQKEFYLDVSQSEPDQSDTIIYVFDSFEPKALKTRGTLNLIVGALETTFLGEILGNPLTKVGGGDHIIPASLADSWGSWAEELDVFCIIYKISYEFSYPFDHDAYNDEIVITADPKGSHLQFRKEAQNTVRKRIRDHLRTSTPAVPLDLSPSDSDSHVERIEITVKCLVKPIM